MKRISIARSASSRCFPDHCRYCAFLAKRGVRNFIVSFGEPKIQHAKVKALGLDREPSVEKIYFADRNNMLTKEAAFRKIQKRTKLTPGEILIVGDRRVLAKSVPARNWECTPSACAMASSSRKYLRDRKKNRIM